MVCSEFPPESEHSPLACMRTHYYELIAPLNGCLSYINRQVGNKTNSPQSRILTDSQIRLLLPYINIGYERNSSPRDSVPVLFLEYKRDNPSIVLCSVNLITLIKFPKQCSAQCRFFLNYYISRGASVIFVINLGDQGEHMEAYSIRS